MCSPHLFDIIQVLDDTLLGDSSETLLGSEVKVHKVVNNHKVADYICYTNNSQCARSLSEIWESKCIEKIPWLKDYIQVTVAPHGFNINLTRKPCFLRGLQNVQSTNKDFGHNHLFQNKMFELSIIESDNLECLTSLRINFAHDIISRIIQACGGVLVSCTNESATVTKVHITKHNSAQCSHFNLLVGPVICRSSVQNQIDSELYKRFRLEDISLMCESKLDLNNPVSLDDKNNLLKAAISFDMFQSCLWRSVTLNVIEKMKDKKSSCKGSMFVMYNYARLFSLCALYAEKVSVGIYPPLPQLDEIDFGLLTQQEEWILFFNSVLSWPSVLKKSIVDLESGRPKIHLLFEFLKTTATNFSLYYHRTRIFTEPRSHLLPVLFARMHLLKALLTVFNAAFKIVGIQPLTKM